MNLFPSFYDKLSTHRTVIQFDGRGTGLSDRDVPDVSAAARARDIEAVVDHLGLESVTLLIWSLNSPAGIIYAATHPERVSREGSGPIMLRARQGTFGTEWFPRRGRG